MDATNIAIGMVLVGALVWVSIIALNLGATRSSVLDLYARTELNKTLISPEDLCSQEQGFELVQPNNLALEPYYVLAGANDFNQTYFCFYEKLDLI